MAVFSPDWRSVAATVCLGAAAVAAAQDVPILLDARSTDFDRRSERLLFEQVSIQRGDLGISADSADSSQLDFSDSTWVFRGQVRITSPDAEVRAEVAIMDFRDHQLRRAKISGAPALFSHAAEASVEVRASEAVVLFGEQDLERVTLVGMPARFDHVMRSGEQVLTRGHARELIYDLKEDQIRLVGDAWVSQADNEIRGEEIAYDIEAQRVVAGGDPDGERVRITITPPAPDTPGDDGTQ